MRRCGLSRCQFGPLSLWSAFAGYVPENFYAPETVNVAGLIEDEAAREAGIKVVEVVLPGGRHKPFGFVHYLERSHEQTPLRFDTDKVAFIDHFKDPAKENALASIARAQWTS